MSHLIFQPFDLLTERRLRNSKPFCSARKMHFFCNNGEDTKGA
jgi:hypothetical protein